MFIKTIFISDLMPFFFFFFFATLVVWNFSCLNNVVSLLEGCSWKWLNNVLHLELDVR